MATRLLKGLGSAFILLPHLKVRFLAMLEVGTLVIGALLCRTAALNGIWHFSLDHLNNDLVSQLHDMFFKPNEVLVFDAGPAIRKTTESYMDFYPFISTPLLARVK